MFLSMQQGLQAVRYVRVTSRTALAGAAVLLAATVAATIDIPPSSGGPGPGMARAATPARGSPQEPCAAARAIATEYAVRATGVQHAAPAAPPSRQERAAEDWVVWRADRDTPGGDAFRHTIVIRVSAREAWVHEVGGFVWTSRWYGPLPVSTADFAGCTPDPRLESLSMYLPR